MGRPKAGLILSEDERSQLTSMARSRSMPADLDVRCIVDNYSSHN
jgi:putative transposase